VAAVNESGEYVFTTMRKACSTVPRSHCRNAPASEHDKPPASPDVHVSGRDRVIYLSRTWAPFEASMIAGQFGEPRLPDATGSRPAR